MDYSTIATDGQWFFPEHIAHDGIFCKPLSLVHCPAVRKVCMHRDTVPGTVHKPLGNALYTFLLLVKPGLLEARGCSPSTATQPINTV